MTLHKNIIYFLDKSKYIVVYLENKDAPNMWQMPILDTLFLSPG